MTAESAQTAKINQNSVVPAEKSCKHYVMMMLCIFFFKYHFAICDTGTQIAKVEATVLSPSLNTFTLPNPYPSASKQVLKCLLENLSNYAGQLLAPPGVHVSCTSSSVTTDVSNRSMVKRFYCLQRTWVNWISCMSLCPSRLGSDGLKRSDTLSLVPRPHRWSGHETRIHSMCNERHREAGARAMYMQHASGNYKVLLSSAC